MSDEGRASVEQVVFVLGMHRSGTSLAAAGLQALGADLGARLMPGSPGDNDKGYFENPDIQALDDRLLEHAGLHFAVPRALPVIAADEPRFADLRREALSLLARDFRGPRVVIKDPRLSLTLGFWRGVCEQAFPGARLQRVVVHRHPLEVAASLARRVGKPGYLHLTDHSTGDPAQAVVLWLAYTWFALSTQPDLPLFVLHHADLAANPAVEIAQLGRFVGLSPSDDALHDFERRIFDPALVHHRSRDSVASRFPDLAAADAACDALSAVRGELDEGAQRALLARFPDLGLALAVAARAHESNAAARRELRSLADQLARVSRERDALATDLALPPGSLRRRSASSLRAFTSVVRRVFRRG